MATATRTPPPAAKARRSAALATPTDLDREGTRNVAAALNELLADTFALYLKTKNFHWHMTGTALPRLSPAPRRAGRSALRDDRRDRGADAASSVRPTLRSIGQIAKLQRVLDNDADFVEPSDMLAELREDNSTLAARMREAHNVCDEHRDVATASLIEVWIDETERRAWFLFETSRRGGTTGH